MNRKTMTHSGTFITKTLSAIVVACALAAVQAVPAAAQTASKLDCKECVKSKHLKDGGIKAKDLKDGVVERDKIADGAVDGSKIADGAVGNDDLTGDSVTGDKIADGAVGNADLAGNSVTGAKIATGAVDSAKVQNNSLTGTDIAGNSVSAGDLSNETGLDIAVQPHANLDSTDEIVMTASVTAPSDGFVWVIAAGTFTLDSGDATGRCSLTTGSATDFNNDVNGAVSAANPHIPFTIMQIYAQSGSTTVGYNLVCKTAAGTDIILDDGDMAAIFFTTQY